MALACGGPTTGRVSDHVTPWLQADPQRCLVIRDLGEGMEFMAKRCAEEFVRQNGYTDLPATEDSTRWVLEVGEGGPWPGILTAREATLEREAATFQCSLRQCLVLFRLRRSALVCGYRVVSMTQVFTKLRLEPGGVQDPRCGDRQS